jgi:hypothetical protein
MVVDVSRDKSRAVLYRMRSRSDNDLCLVELATGKEHLLTPHTRLGTSRQGRSPPITRPYTSPPMAVAT